MAPELLQVNVGHGCGSDQLRDIRIRRRNRRRAFRTIDIIVGPIVAVIRAVTVVVISKITTIKLGNELSLRFGRFLGRPMRR